MGFRCLRELLFHCAGSSGNVVRALRAGLFVRSGWIANQASIDAMIAQPRQWIKAAVWNL